MTRPRKKGLLCRTLLAGLATLAFCLAHAAGQAVPAPGAQRIPGAEGEPVAGDTGLELALYGDLVVRPGRPLSLTGTAFSTRGFGTLVREAGLTVTAEVFVATTDLDDSFVPVPGARVRVTAAADGDFTLSVPTPSTLGARPHVVVRLESPRGTTRGFGFPLATLSPFSTLVRADRRRYEPGETVHAWIRVLDAESGAPVPGEALEVAVRDGRDVAISLLDVVTGESGSVTADVPLGESASGTHRIVVRRAGASVLDAPLGTTDFVVETRRTARILGTFELARDWALPGEPIAGTLSVTTPSHAPLAHAAIEVRAHDEVVVRGETDESGTLAFSIEAPTFLDVETRSERVSATITHALGSLELSDSYLLARSPWQVALTPEAGALGVGVPSRVVVAVTDPVGEPIAAGVELEVRGAGLSGDRALGRTDTHGLWSFSPTVPPAGVATAVGGDCSGSVAATYVVEVRTTPPIEVSACVLASRRTELAIELTSPVAAPGTTVGVMVRRRPGLEALPVLLELHDARRTYAQATLGPRDTRGAIAIPLEARGVLGVRARLLHPDDAMSPPGEEGARGSGQEALAQLVVRPTDAFELALAVDPALVRVRETTHVSLTTTPAPARAWAALLLRDEAQHDGEVPFAFETLTEDLRAAVRGALGPADELLVRLALAAPAPSEVRGAMPVTTEPWEDPYGEAWNVGGTAIVSDPVALREELRRTQAGAWMSALVVLLRQLGGEGSDVRSALLAERGGRLVFSARALEIAAERRLGPATEVPRVLGGLALTADMLSELDPSFSLDSAARMVARWQLVELLGRLNALTSTSDTEALRAIDGQPVSRWLAILVALGWADVLDLRDPWGRPFAITCAPGRTPHVLFSSRASTCELASPGPDGRPGTSDDVADPFARVVPEGTLFASASGEDLLMERLSRIAPGESALAQMAAAYGELTLAAHDETIEAALFAHPSEAADEELVTLFGDAIGSSFGLAGMGSIGHGSGSGSGYGYGSGSGRMGHRSVSGPSIRVALSAAIREDLPATLFFAGEIPLDASGRAVVPVRAADAMSSYHVEAVAWSETGWTTSARASLRVDQDVEIDAPVPEVLHVGDEVRLTLRLRSRALDALRVHVSVETEGPIAMTSPEVMDLPAGGISVASVTLRASEVGSGSVLLRATLEDGSPLDAIRRRVAVWEDARTASRLVRRLVSEAGSMTLEVPPDAMARDVATVRVSSAPDLFSPSGGADRPYAEWAEALRGGALPAITSFAGDGDEAVRLAFATGALYASELLDDETAARALRAITAAATGVPLPGDGSGTVEDRVGSAARAEPASAAWLLLGLAPALRSSARPALREDLEAVASLLREGAAGEGARASDAPETWARVAAALALAGEPEDAARATEMLRRLEARTIAVRDMAWIEPALDDGSAEPRVEPTALAALALVHSGRAADALPLVTALVDVARGVDGWTPRAAGLARAAALALVPIMSSAPALTVDGVPTELGSGATPSATLASLGAPGTHLLTLTSPGLSVLEAEATFGLPWTRAPARPPRVEVEITGEVGARDTRAALVVRIRNVGARALREPSIRILLPSGAELEEAERTTIRNHTGRAPVLERDELVVTSRPLLPGRTLTFPVRVRWSLAGSLRGLGITVTDAAIPADPDAAFVVPSRVVDIAEEGAEPELDLDIEAEDAPAPRARDLVVRPLPESL